MRLMALNLALALTLTLVACGGGDDDPTPPPVADAGGAESDAAGGGDDTAETDAGVTPEPGPYDAVVEALTPGCGGCHGGDDGCTYGAACFLDDVEVMSQSVVNSAACGDATDFAGCSVVRINDGTMPLPGSANPVPTEDDVQVLVDWIDAGMPAE